MTDAAQGEPKQHEVFEKPFKVEPVFSSAQTPASYRRNPGGESLPARIKFWRIQEPKKGTLTVGSVVSRSWGFEDSPDAEILVPGLNFGKESGAVGIGRHANFLQWGFNAPPSQMTEAGRRLFLNCIGYIAKFDGKAPLVRAVSPPREIALLLAGVAPDQAERTFAESVRKEFKGNPKGLRGHLQKHFELIYFARGTFAIDQDLLALGILSNRKPATLERLITLLAEGKNTPTVQKLLARYTDRKFTTAREWQEWFAQNQGRIYFSDVGGYKFRTILDGYQKL